MYRSIFLHQSVTYTSGRSGGSMTVQEPRGTTDAMRYLSRRRVGAAARRAGTAGRSGGIVVG